MSVHKSEGSLLEVDLNQIDYVLGLWVQTRPAGFESGSDPLVFGPGLASSRSGSFSAKLPRVIKIGIVVFLYVDNIVCTSTFLWVYPSYLYLSLGLSMVSGPIWYWFQGGGSGSWTRPKT